MALERPENRVYGVERRAPGPEPRGSRERRDSRGIRDKEGPGRALTIDLELTGIGP
jgi:hypothetical protein